LYLDIFSLIRGLIWFLHLFNDLAMLRLQVHGLSEQVLDGSGHCLKFQGDQTPEVFVFKVIKGEHGVFMHAKLVATLDILGGQVLKIF
jgi:hypothetical protein